jgi:hypothetical protein
VAIERACADNGGSHQTQLNSEQAVKLRVVLDVFDRQDSVYGVQMVFPIQMVANHVQQ